METSSLPCGIGLGYGVLRATYLEPRWWIITYTKDPEIYGVRGGTRTVGTGASVVHAADAALRYNTYIVPVLILLNICTTFI